MENDNWKIISETEIPVYYYSACSYPIATAIIGFIQNGFTISDINTGSAFLNKKIDGKDSLLFADIKKQSAVCIVIMSDLGYDGNSFRGIYEFKYPGVITIKSYNGNEPPVNNKLSEFIKQMEHGK